VVPSSDSIEVIQVLCYDIISEDVVGPEIEEEPYFASPMMNDNWDSDEPDENIYAMVEIMPEFPGGTQGVLDYIQEKIIYPPKALKDSIEGKVLVSFVIEKDSSISSVKILRGIDESLDKEALRIIRNMPKWVPGKHREKNLRVRFVLPVRFNLPDKKSEK